MLKNESANTWAINYWIYRQVLIPLDHEARWFFHAHDFCTMTILSIDADIYKFTRSTSIVLNYFVFCFPNQINQNSTRVLTFFKWAENFFHFPFIVTEVNFQLIIADQKFIDRQYKTITFENHSSKIKLLSIKQV